MADFDVHSRSEDAGHEAIRVAVVQAIADGANNASGVDDSLLLVDTLFDLLDTALTDRQALADRTSALEDTVTQLQAAVTALQPPLAAP